MRNKREREESSLNIIINSVVVLLYYFKYCSSSILLFARMVLYVGAFLEKLVVRPQMTLHTNARTPKISPHTCTSCFSSVQVDFFVSVYFLCKCQIVLYTSLFKKRS